MKEYVQSARKAALLILGAGVIALQIGWGERARQDRQALFGYLEKVLKANALTAAHPERHPNLDTADLPPQLGRILSDGKATELEASEEAFRTHADPRGSCLPRVFAPPGDGWFLVWFPRECGRLQGLLDPVVIIAGDEQKLMLPPSIVQITRVERSWPAGPPDVPHLDAVVQYLTDPAKYLGLYGGVGIKDPPGVRSKASIEGFIIEAAARDTGRQLGSVDEAFGALVSSDVETPKILGFAVEPRLAVLVLPAVLVGLSFTFFHRVRRISPPLDDIGEPWLALMPHGFVERIAAGLFGLGMLLVPGVTFWSVLVYDPAALSELSEAIRLLLKGPVGAQKLVGLTRFNGTWQTLTNKAVLTALPALVSQAFILVGLWHLRRIGAIHRVPSTTRRRPVTPGKRGPARSLHEDQRGDPAGPQLAEDSPELD